MTGVKPVQFFPKHIRSNLRTLARKDTILTLITVCCVLGPKQMSLTSLAILTSKGSESKILSQMLPRNDTESPQTD